MACTIYETSDRVGGRILTEVVDHEAGRFVVEGGPDSFITAQKPWALDLSHDIGLGGDLLGTNDAGRKVYVLSHGRPVPLPDGVFLLLPTKFKPFLLSPLISPWGKLRMGLDVLVPKRTDSSDETLGDFVTRRLGAEALDKIAEPLLSGIYNAEAQKQSLLATFPRFRDTEMQYGSLIKGMLAQKAQARKAKRAAAGGAAAAAGSPGAPGAQSGAGAPGAGASGSGAPSRPGPKSMFVSFVEGTEELTRSLGGREELTFKLNVRVDAIRPEAGGGYTLKVARSAAGAPGAGNPAQSEAVRADAVILAVPAYDARSLLTPLSAQAGDILETFRYVSTGTISLAFRESDSLDRIRRYGFGVLSPTSEKRPLNAITCSSTKFDHRAPAGSALIRAFFGGSRSPGSMLLSDEELFKAIKQQFRDILGITEEPLFHRIYRWEKANPQYDVEHLARVDALERALPQDLRVTGSPYRGVGIPDCVHQAQLTAEQVVGRLKDRQRSAL